MQRFIQNIFTHRLIPDYDCFSRASITHSQLMLRDGRRTAIPTPPADIARDMASKAHALSEHACRRGVPMAQMQKMPPATPAAARTFAVQRAAKHI